MNRLRHFICFLAFSGTVVANAQKVTRVPLAGNVIVNIEGDYPNGYNPNWQYINSKDPVPITITNYLMTRGNVATENMSVGFSDINGKMVFQFIQGGSYCLADLDIQGGAVTLSESPSTFSLVNWRYEKGGPCSTSPNRRTYEGKVSLSASKEGNLGMSLQVDVYSAPGRNNEVRRTFNYVSNNVSIPNKLTPTQAYAKAADDKKKEIARIEDEKRRELYKKERERLDKEYEKALPIYEAKAKALMKIETVYKGYSLKQLLSLADMIPKSRACGKINNGKKTNEELSDEMDVLLKSYNTIMSNIHFDPKKLEPHEKDGRFAHVYLYRRGFNELVVKLAARYSICDKEYFDQLSEELTLTKSDFYEDWEYNQMLEYLKKKN